MAGINVGRFNFNQQTKSGFSYARSADEDDIYSIDGYLSLSAQRQFNSFRNAQLLSTDVSNLETIMLEFEGSESVLSKSLDGTWIKDGAELDSTDVKSFISKLQSLTGTDFVDDFNPNSNTKLASLVLGENSIDAYGNDGNGFIIKSSENDAYFKSDSTGIYKSAILDFIAL